MKTTTRLRATALAALLVLAVSACGGEVTGSPAGQAYSPPDPATATAQSIDLEEAVAVSPAGTLLAIAKDNSLCVRDRVPTGAKGTSSTCAEDPDITGRQPAVFSPTGSRLVVFENPGQYGNRARAWIVDASSGTTVPITLPAATSSNGPSPTAPSPTSTTGTGSALRDAAVTYLWQSDDALFAVGITGAVYRITPSTGAAVVLAPSGDRTKETVTVAAIGGGTIAMVWERRSRGGARLVTVSIADGAVRDPAVTFDQDITHPILLGVSPDGGKALLSTANLQTLVPGETGIYDLTSGQHTVIAGTERTYAAGGAFSPDGSVVAFVASGAATDLRSKPTAADGNRFHLQLAPADGSTAPRDLLGADDETRNVYGPLLWSPAGVIVTAASPSPQAAAWIVTG